MTLAFVPITNLHDNLLLPWLDLFETAFPPHEKILVSTIIQILHGESDGKHQETKIMALLDDNSTFIGMAMYQLPSDAPVGVLWYVAVAPDQRSRGWGTQIYNGILSQLDPAVHQALIFEVEIPGQPASSPEAARRIRFYQKNGARLLTGIHYLQSVGWHQPLTPMHIMIHPLHPLDAETAYQLAHSLFGDALQKTGPLALE